MCGVCVCVCVCVSVCVCMCVHIMCPCLCAGLALVLSVAGIRVHINTVLQVFYAGNHLILYSTASFVLNCKGLHYVFKNVVK